MRVIPAAIALIASLSGPEPRFFAKEVDFWGRPARRAPVDAWRGETSPPPGPARDLLESPTPENARRYLEWQQERLERLQKALEALEAATAEVSPAPEILLFARDECPYSRAQEEVLRGLPVNVLKPGQSPALWIQHDVKATPTLVVRGKTVVGLTDRRQVETLLRGGAP